MTTEAQATVSDVEFNRIQGQTREASETRQGIAISHRLVEKSTKDDASLSHHLYTRAAPQPINRELYFWAIEDCDHCDGCQYCDYTPCTDF